MRKATKIGFIAVFCAAVGLTFPVFNIFSKQLSMDSHENRLMTGLPRVFTVSSSEMIEAFEEPSTRILEAIHGVLERTPPELVADISTNGICMTGGGSLVWGFDKLIESHTGIETHVADDAISCVPTALARVWTTWTPCRTAPSTSPAESR